jgi:hypothetical protein
LVVKERMNEDLVGVFEDRGYVAIIPCGVDYGLIAWGSYVDGKFVDYEQKCVARSTLYMISSNFCRLRGFALAGAVAAMD